jgi:hypothetical protein
MLTETMPPCTFLSAVQTGLGKPDGPSRLAGNSRRRGAVDARRATAATGRIMARLSRERTAIGQALGLAPRCRSICSHSCCAADGGHI